MSVVSLQPTRPLFIAFQGGAALGAFSLGAIEAISEQNPNRKVIGVTGTSSGALTASYFAEGYLKGGLPEAVRRSTELWESMSKFQNDSCSNFWFKYDDVENMAAFSGQLPMMRAMMQAANEFAYRSSQPALSSSPILGFLAKMKQEGKSLDFVKLQNADPKDFLVIVNATHVPEKSNPWLATATDERLFTNSSITPAVLAASGALIELVPPIVINREPLRDGAYFSNPHLPMAAKQCVERGADLVVIRTRPGGAFQDLNGKIPQTDDDRRAFFNNMLDAQLAEVRRDYPQLNVIVIEPRRLEEQNYRRLLKPELSFHPHDIESRRIDGYNTAIDIMDRNPNLFPMRRNMSMPVVARHVQLDATATISAGAR